MNKYFKVNEIWRKSNICPNYEVSNYTQIREIGTGNIVKQYLIDDNIKGYYQVTLNIGSKERIFKVDDLVNDAFPDVIKSKLKPMNVNGHMRMVHNGFCSDRRITHKYYDTAKVRSVYDGKIYNSIRDCSLDSGISMCKIARSMENSILTANIPKRLIKGDFEDPNNEMRPYKRKCEQINYVPLPEVQTEYEEEL